MYVCIYVCKHTFPLARSRSHLHKYYLILYEALWNSQAISFKNMQQYQIVLALLLLIHKYYHSVKTKHIKTSVTDIMNTSANIKEAILTLPIKLNSSTLPKPLPLVTSYSGAQLPPVWCWLKCFGHRLIQSGTVIKEFRIILQKYCNGKILGFGRVSSLSSQAQVEVKPQVIWVKVKIKLQVFWGFAESNICKRLVKFLNLKDCRHPFADTSWITNSGPHGKKIRHRPWQQVHIFGQQTVITCRAPNTNPLSFRRAALPL